MRASVQNLARIIPATRRTAKRWVIAMACGITRSRQAAVVMLFPIWPCWPMSKFHKPGSGRDEAHRIRPPPPPMRARERERERKRGREEETERERGARESEAARQRQRQRDRAPHTASAGVVSLFFWHAMPSSSSSLVAVQATE